jgi:Type IV secretion-system coupling protein DNA-binding domain
MVDKNKFGLIITWFFFSVKASYNLGLNSLGLYVKLAIDPKINDKLIKMNSDCYLGLLSHEEPAEAFAIKANQRQKHLYIIGKTGMGKTTLLSNMILQDIYNGQGVCLIEPHGDCSEYILDRIPKHRQQDVIYFDPADTDFPIGLNILEPQKSEAPFLISSTLLSAFNKIWAGAWSSRMEYILANTLLTLLESEGQTLLGVIKLLTDENYRKDITSKLQDPLLKNFWDLEFAKFNERYRQEAISPILNKIGQFFANPLIRNILGQTTSTINLRQIMDEGKILICNLSKGRLGEENSNLLGALLISKLQITTMSRVDEPEASRRNFFVYVDEFQNFTSDSFASILSEARKYRLNLTLAHQYIAQLNENGTTKVKNAIFGNVGNLVSFRVGAEDSDFMSKEFGHKIESKKLLNLKQGQIAVKLGDDRDYPEPFIGFSLPPLYDKLAGQKDTVISQSRHKYGTSRDKVDAQIATYLEPVKDTKKKNPKKLPE